MIYNGLEVYSVSMIHKFLSCNRAYKWRYAELLTHEYKSKALSFGSTIHDGLATWYKTQDLATTCASMEKIGAEFNLEPLSEIDPKHSIERAREIMVKYVNRYQGRDLTMTMVEVPFIIEVEMDEGEKPFLFAGTIDGIWEQDGNMYIAEHKTTTRMGTDYIKSFHPNNQITAYSWALAKYLDKPLTGSIINIIHILTKETNFIRHTTRRMEWELHDWEQELKEIVRHIRRIAETGIYVKNTSQCNVYGSCSFQTLCNTHPDNVVNFIEAEFSKDVPGDLTWLLTKEKGEVNV